MSLLFPLYFLGMLGLGLPWLLHRFSDQQPEEKLFPSTRFLDATTPPVSRKRRLKYLSLLALRVLSLVLLCFLFAQPWFARQDQAVPARQHHIVAIDQSMSMRATQRWDSAVDQTQALLDELPSTDSVALFGFDNTVRQVASSDDQPGAIGRALSSMQPGYSSADYGRVMQLLNTRAAEHELPVKLWLVTDQQRSSLPAQLNALYAPQVNEFELVSVIEQPQFNVHLAAAAQTEDGVNLRVSVQLTASQSMDSADSNAAADESAPATQAQPGANDESVSVTEQAAREVTISVTSADQLLTQRTTLIAPGNLETVIFDELILPAGENPVLRVALQQQDALAIDNAVELVVTQANPTPVQLLQSDRDTSANAAVFVTTALETDDYASVSVVTGNSEQVPPDTAHIVTGRDLSADPLALDVLQFVDAGNNALVFDSRLSRSNDAAARAPREVGLVDQTHPLALGDIDWFGIRFYDVPPLSLIDNDRILLETTEREPILIERQVERGRLLILNDRLDGRGSNLPLQPAFVSLMHALLNYFDASTALPTSMLVGERLTLPANVQVLGPDEEPLLTLDASGRSGSLQLLQPGLYTIIGLRGEHVLRVILDTNESDLTTLDERVTRAWQARYDDVTVPDTGSGSLKLPAIDKRLLAQGNDNNRLSLWQWLLPALIMILILESWLANRRLDVRRDGS